MEMCDNGMNLSEWNIESMWNNKPLFFLIVIFDGNFPARKSNAIIGTIELCELDCEKIEPWRSDELQHDVVEQLYTPDTHAHVNM